MEGLKAMLLELKGWHQEGLLSDDEFATQKKNIMDKVSALSDLHVFEKPPNSPIENSPSKSPVIEKATNDVPAMLSPVAKRAKITRKVAMDTFPDPLPEPKTFSPAITRAIAQKNFNPSERIGFVSEICLFYATFARYPSSAERIKLSIFWTNKFPWLKDPPGLSKTAFDSFDQQLYFKFQQLRKPRKGYKSDQVISEEINFTSSSSYSS
eukprot:Pompholyxophrys_sp_v1_NODE_19_length_4057_cov_7.699150.p2 type:complete len:210 gc:universal NODE_19_length_4057_cov_7.699150:759-130(-)